MKTAEESLTDPRVRTALRGMKTLVSSYLALSVITLVAVVFLRDNAAMVNDAVWIRGTIVVASAAMLFSFTMRAARGSRTGYRRLRIAAAVMVVAIAVIIAVPGPFPAWLKIEQGVCGLILLAVVVIANGRHLRAVFAGK